MFRWSGLTAEVQERVEALEKAALQASHRLQEAAADGSFVSYRSALDVAKRYNHLSGLIEESGRVFSARQCQAAMDVQEAVERRPLTVWRVAAMLASMESMASLVRKSIGHRF